MIRQFRETKFKPDSLVRIEQMNAIIAEFSRQDLTLSARQLYYQFVSRGLIANQPAEYKKLTALLTDARYAGLVDWDAIEDRGRVAQVPAHWSGLPSLVDSACASYRLDRWKGQKNYAELWVEKQALAGVLYPLSREFHVPLIVNKGYSSASAMYESAMRIIEHTAAREDDLVVPNCFERAPTICYLGDHDPSGEDMVRDIRDRLIEFGVTTVQVVKIALTMKQVRQYNPPPNPAKVTDPRASQYVKKHGDESWEVDALPPDVLARLIRQTFERLIDKSLMDKIKRQEELDKTTLRKAVVGLGKTKRREP